MRPWRPANDESDDPKVRAAVAGSLEGMIKTLGGAAQVDTTGLRPLCRKKQTIRQSK